MSRYLHHTNPHKAARKPFHAVLAGGTKGLIDLAQIDTFDGDAVTLRDNHTLRLTPESYEAVRAAHTEWAMPIVGARCAKSIARAMEIAADAYAQPAKREAA